MKSLQPQPILIQPNQFLLRGHDIEITYEAANAIGVPQLFYQDRNRVQNFRDDQIFIEETQSGQTVTVTLSIDPQTIGSAETLTLLIPTISVLSTSKTAPIQTVAFFSLRLPLLKPPDQSQTFLPVSLSGMANQIDF